MRVLQKRRVFPTLSFVVLYAALGSASLGWGQEGEVNPFSHQASKTSESQSEVSTKETPTATERRFSASMRDLNRDREIENLLQMEVDLKIDKMPLQDLLAHLMDNYSLQCLLDRSAAEDMLSLESSMSCHLSGVRLEVALANVLREHNATFIVDGGLVRIISKDVEDNREFFSTQIIDCRSILALLPEPTELKLSPETTKTLMSVGRLMLSGQNRLNSNEPFVVIAPGSLLAIPSAPITPPAAGGVAQVAEQPDSCLNLVVSPVTKEDVLMSAIIGAVATDEWSQTNGEGEIRFVGGIMVISQRRVVIRKVEDLLSQLQAQLDN